MDAIASDRFALPDRDPQLIPVIPPCRYTPRAAIETIRQWAGPLPAWWAILLCLGLQGQIMQLSVLAQDLSMENIQRLKPRVVIRTGQRAEGKTLVLVQRAPDPFIPDCAQHHAVLVRTMHLALLAASYRLALHDHLLVFDEEVLSLRTVSRVRMPWTSRAPWPTLQHRELGPDEFSRLGITAQLRTL